MMNDGVSFKESAGSINQTELVGELICRGTTLTDGIVNMYRKIQGSVSLLLLSGMRAVSMH
ncbi:MAG: Glutamine amidotransferase type-2 protein [Thermoproteota archaeon]|nr:Glutamine amidotransferase type-2 protein [Thermoproteota archaeon]